MENTICPKCGENKYYWKYVNYKEILLCGKCGYFDYFICEDELGLMDLEDKKQ